jgi:hypothetical protein
MASMTIRRWRDLPADHRRWIVINALLITAFVNLVINGFLAWFSVRGHHTVPVWGLPGIGKTNVFTDTVGTFFFLPLFTCATCTTAVWAQVRSGRLPRLETAIPRALAHGRLRRGAVLGLTTAAVLAPITVAIVAVARLGSVSASDFVLYKMALGVVLGLVVTPLIAFLAMTDAAGAQPAL